MLNKKSAAKYLLLQKSFAGMSVVVAELASKEDTELVYLSNASKNWMGYLHREFLELNLFPAGAIILRDEFPSESHKLMNLRRLRDQYKPNRMILIGDNGERDVEIYTQFAKESTSIQLHIFIRQAYSTKDSKYPGKSLAAGQLGFVTSLDLGLLLFDQGVIEQDMFETLQIELQKVPLFEGDSFPAWLNCADFKWSVSEKLTQSQPAFVAHRARLQQRCQFRHLN